MVATGAPVTGLGQVGGFIDARGRPRDEQLHVRRHRHRPGRKGDERLHPHRERAGRRQALRERRPGRARAGRLRRPRLRRGDARRRLRLHPAAAGPLDRRRAGPRVGPDDGAHRGRVYLVYTLEEKNESDDTNIYVRYSDDDGRRGARPSASTTTPGRTASSCRRSRSIRRRAKVAVVWYDARNDLGTGGAGDTDGVPNDDAQFWGAFTSDGSDFTPNVQISAGTSNSARLGQRDRLRRLQRARVLRRRRAPGVVRQLQQHRDQPGRNAEEARHLHGQRPTLRGWWRWGPCPVTEQPRRSGYSAWEAGFPWAVRQSATERWCDWPVNWCGPDRGSVRPLRRPHPWAAWMMPSLALITAYHPGSYATVQHTWQSATDSPRCPPVVIS